MDKYNLLKDLVTSSGRIVGGPRYRLLTTFILDDAWRPGRGRRGRIPRWLRRHLNLEKSRLTSKSRGKP